jgi:hypothetical protein
LAPEEFIIDIYTFEGIHLQQMKGEGVYCNCGSFHITSNGLITIIGETDKDLLNARVRCII